LIQLRSNHIPLNAYLFRFKKADSAMCPKCAKRRLRIKETVNHYLFACPEWKEQRQKLQEDVGRGKARSMKGLMASKESVKSLLEFIHATGRFRKTPGEV
ncbi:hypothetical protein BDN72DRAFT_748338, partial [Pluteus cervinus]